MSDLGSDFLLNEYERLHDMWVDSLTRSEQRVNFFLAAASVVAGGLFFLFGKDVNLSPAQKALGAEAVLGLLLCFGLITLNRVTWGSVQRRLCLDRLMAALRDQIAQQSPEVSRYVQLRNSLLAANRCPRAWLGALMHFHRGRLTDFMILVCSVLCGSMVGIALHGLGGTTALDVALSLGTTLVSAPLLYAYYAFVRDHVPLE